MRQPSHLFSNHLINLDTQSGTARRSYSQLFHGVFANPSALARALRERNPRERRLAFSSSAFITLFRTISSLSPVFQSCEARFAGKIFTSIIGVHSASLSSPHDTMNMLLDLIFQTRHHKPVSLSKQVKGRVELAICAWIVGGCPPPDNEVFKIESKYLISFDSSYFLPFMFSSPQLGRFS